MDKKINVKRADFGEGTNFLLRHMMDKMANKILFNGSGELKREEIMRNLKRYLVIVISHNNYISCQSLFRKYKFTLACIQDFSHINDVNNKLTSLDMSNIYKYVICYK